LGEKVMVVGNLVSISSGVYQIVLDTVSFSQVSISVVVDKSFQIFMFSLLFFFSFFVGVYVASNS
jgi:hypothetical protein